MLSAQLHRPTEIQDSVEKKTSEAAPKDKKRKALQLGPIVEQAIAPLDEQTGQLRTYAPYEQLLGKICDLQVRIIRWWHGKLYGPNRLPSIVFLVVDEKVCTHTYTQQCCLFSYVLSTSQIILHLLHLLFQCSSICACDRTSISMVQQS